MDEQRLRIGSERRPNVVWIFGDQHRAQATSYRGDPNLTTPNIDNLARNGMRFDSAVSGAPWCTPFRAALLTGRYPHQVEVPQTPSRLSPEIPTIARVFNEAGYHTSWTGKWHLDGSNDDDHYVPPGRRGRFAWWMGYENSNNQNETWIYGSEGEEAVRLDGYVTDSLTDRFIAHLEEHLAESNDGDYQPFFSVLSVQPPHSPYVPPDSSGGSAHSPAQISFRPNVPHSKRVRSQAALDLAGYSGMIENLDLNLGRIRGALKRLGVDRETYIVFFSDHGDCLGSHGQWEKSSPWEEAIRIPFIVSTLGGSYHMRIGSSDALVNHVDIAPTTLGLCGIEQPEWMGGHDYSDHCVKPDRPEWGMVPREAAEPDSAFLQQIPRKFHPHSVNRAWRGVVTRDGWKYVCMPDHEWLLFDLNDDPYEMANLAFDVVFQAQKERCHALLAEWIRTTGDRFPLPDISMEG